MVTKSAEELTAVQRRPHFDGFRFGGLVYLNPEDQCHGGTGFYRHRATGLSRYPDELNDEIRAVISRHGLNSLEELQHFITTPSPGHSEGYITDSDADWERICFAEMKFNRFIIYDGQIFHSGVFEDGDFGEMSVERRLTLNFFAGQV